MSRILIRPAQQRFDRLAERGVKAGIAIAIVTLIFQSGAMWQRSHVAVNKYCAQDMTACWYEADFTNR